MQENDGRIKQIFNRHIARTLTFLENSKTNIDIRNFVKSELWATYRDVIASNEGVQNEINDRNAL